MDDLQERLEELEQGLISAWTDLHNAAKTQRVMLQQELRAADQLERTIDQVLPVLLQIVQLMQLELLEDDAGASMASER